MLLYMCNGQASSCEGVTVSEVTGTELALTITTTAAISWVFEITTSVSTVATYISLLIWGWHNNVIQMAKNSRYIIY